MRCFVDGGANVKQQIQTFLAGGVFALVLLGVAVAGPREDGWTAYGRGDYATAMTYWRPLADQGNVLAQLILGQMYLKGGGGVPQDSAQALVWYRKAADQGDAAAQGMLGKMYARGQGVPQSDADAVTWYRKAAEQGNAMAQANLGFAYVDGQGVPQDYAQAALWCRKAAEQGYTAAQNVLGEMSAEGKGVPQDYVTAHMWFNLSASRATEAEDRDSAAKKRDELAAKMTPAQIAEAQRLAREWKPTTQ
jgi:TPR repeat protein